MSCCQTLPLLLHWLTKLHELLTFVPVNVINECLRQLHRCKLLNKVTKQRRFAKGVLAQAPALAPDAFILKTMAHPRQLKRVHGNRKHNYMFSGSQTQIYDMGL